MLDLLELLFAHPIKLVCHEDNDATIKAIKKGYSPCLRSMQRTARISLGFAHEVFHEDEVDADDGEPPRFGIRPVLVHCPTKEMRADVFTKTLDRVSFANALEMLNCVGKLA